MPIPTPETDKICLFLKQAKYVLKGTHIFLKFGF